ncbi:MAG: hypothetical protein AB7N76_14180 [Planctomycetota bacterium]
MSREQVITLYPTRPDHRLVGPQLSTFLDRLGLHLVALGHGAVARLAAGGERAEARSWASLVVALDAARQACRGTADLRIDLEGPARDRFARFLGARTVRLRFEAFVEPRECDGQRVCWWLQLRGQGERGVGERVVEEGRRLEGTDFAEALAGAARVSLAELQEWRPQA